MTNNYVVSAYYGSSECVYTFGLFHSEKAVDAFIEKLTASEKHYEGIIVDLVNAPSLFETGQEMSIHPS